MASTFTFGSEIWWNGNHSYMLIFNSGNAKYTFHSFLLQIHYFHAAFASASNQSPWLSQFELGWRLKKTAITVPIVQPELPFSPLKNAN